MKQLSSEMPIKCTSWLASYHHVLIPSSMPSAQNDWVLKEISAAALAWICMDWFNTNGQTDIRFFFPQNIGWRKIQLLAPNAVSILPSSVTFNHTYNCHFWRIKGELFYKAVLLCVLFFRDKLEHIERFREHLAIYSYVETEKRWAWTLWVVKNLESNLSLSWLSSF